MEYRFATTRWRRPRTGASEASSDCRTSEELEASASLVPEPRVGASCESGRLAAICCAGAGALCGDRPSFGSPTSRRTAMLTTHVGSCAGSSPRARCIPPSPRRRASRSRRRSPKISRRTRASKSGFSDYLCVDAPDASSVWLGSMRGVRLSVRDLATSVRSASAFTRSRARTVADLRRSGIVLASHVNGGRRERGWSLFAPANEIVDLDAERVSERPHARDVRVGHAAILKSGNVMRRQPSALGECGLCELAGRAMRPDLAGQRHEVDRRRFTRCCLDSGM